MKMVREVLRYGVAAELSQGECQRLLLILGATEFKQPARRRSKLEVGQVLAFVRTALEAGRPSLAIGTLIQFETGMRQRDVIGEWVPIAGDEERSGIVIRGRRGQEWRRWCNGLTWSDISRDFIISKATTKTGAIVSHDLKLFPLILELLDAIPAERRIGPLIVDEVANRPYAEFGYAREWRAIARRAGIPDEVWNMDARAGAITEAEDAGADLDAIRSTVGHTQQSTTEGYLRGALGKSRAVANLRQAHRANKNKD